MTRISVIGSAAKIPLRYLASMALGLSICCSLGREHNVSLGRLRPYMLAGNDGSLLRFNL